jgi:hypothetical protein
MRTKILATWAIGILGILLGRPVHAATAVVLYEPQRPAIVFGANDLIEALRQKRVVVDTADPGALTTKSAPIPVRSRRWTRGGRVNGVRRNWPYEFAKW